LCAAGLQQLPSPRHAVCCDLAATTRLTPPARQTDWSQGNGTQAIVEAAEDPDALLFFSVHLFDSDRDCPNCVPRETLQGQQGKQQGAGAKARLMRPPARATSDESDFEFYPGTVRETIADPARSRALSLHCGQGAGVRGGGW
jgi:hypothetical protein